MLPVIAIVGRPNVGKSTLFNGLTQSRDALVADFPGLTRDRLYGHGQADGRNYIVVDTGGLSGDAEGIAALMASQTQAAIQEADFILFLVDGRAGISATDREIAHQLRKLAKPILLVVNKVDDLDVAVACADFYTLGLGEPCPIVAAQRRGIHEMITAVLQQIPRQDIGDAVASEQKGIRLAVVGRPNVGKSTLINRMLGEERVVVSDQPGTTRDSIYIPFTRRDQEYILIDTAGMRRRSKIEELIEKFSVIKTLQAIESADVVILVLNAQEGITEQDLHILGFILRSGRALVIAVNKWDGLTQDQRDITNKSLDRRLVFVNFARIKYISALHGTGVGELFPLVDEAYQAATKKHSTADLTRILMAAVAAHQPPLVSGRRIKLRYAHAGGHRPPLIIIHGKQTRSLPESYRTYLAGFFRKKLHLVGTPIRIEFKDSENPYVKS